MTVYEAIEQVQQRGTIYLESGKLKLRFPESERDVLQVAIDTLRVSKAEAMALLAQPDPTESARGCDVLNRAGVRIMALEDGAAIGVWSDLDGPEIRTALRALQMSHLPIRYLDGEGIPTRYKTRLVDGEPVPMNVLAEIERNPKEPWKIRDRMLNEMGWHSKPIRCPWRAAPKGQGSNHSQFEKWLFAFAVTIKPLSD